MFLTLCLLVLVQTKCATFHHKTPPSPPSTPNNKPNMKRIVIILIQLGHLPQQLLQPPPLLPRAVRKMSQSQLPPPPPPPPPNPNPNSSPTSNPPPSTMVRAQRLGITMAITLQGQLRMTTSTFTCYHNHPSSHPFPPPFHNNQCHHYQWRLSARLWGRMHN